MLMFLSENILRLSAMRCRFLHLGHLLRES